MSFPREEYTNRCLRYLLAACLPRELSATRTRAGGFAHFAPVISLDDVGFTIQVLVPYAETSSQIKTSHADGRIKRRYTGRRIRSLFSSFIMARIPETPVLTPQLCFDTTALRGKFSICLQICSLKAHAHLSASIDFLRISRSAVDDTISQNLNALATPSAAPFDPRSTAERQTRHTSRQALPIAKCQDFKDTVLFPSWQSRTDVLNYCAGVATSPDPSDPDHVLRETEDARARERLIDERLDPYSARYFPREARTEALASLIRNERMVEGIIRSRTWKIVGERCQSDGFQEADKAVDEWRRRKTNHD